MRPKAWERPSEGLGSPLAAPTHSVMCAARPAAAQPWGLLCSIHCFPWSLTFWHQNSIKLFINKKKIWQLVCWGWKSSKTESKQKSMTLIKTNQANKKTHLFKPKHFISFITLSLAILQSLSTLYDPTQLLLPSFIFSFFSFPASDRSFLHGHLHKREQSQCVKYFTTI